MEFDANDAPTSPLAWAHALPVLLTAEQAMELASCEVSLYTSSPNGVVDGDMLDDGPLAEGLPHCEWQRGSPPRSPTYATSSAESSTCVLGRFVPHGASQLSSASAFSQRSVAWEKQRAQKLENLRRWRESCDLAECSFKPRHSEGCRTTALGRGASAALADRLSTSLPSCPRRMVKTLYEQSCRQECAERQCTFKPDLSLSESSLGLRASSIRPSMYSPSMSSSVGRQVARSPPGEQYSFRPSTNLVADHMIQASMYLDTDVFARLYEGSSNFVACSTRRDPGVGRFSQDIADGPSKLLRPTFDLAPARGRGLALARAAGSTSCLIRKTMSAPWLDFLRRQEELNDERIQRLRDLEDAYAPTGKPQLSERSRTIASQQMARGRASGGSLGHESSRQTVPQFSFRPSISGRAAQRPPRSPYEMSIGDARRRVAAVEVMRERLQRGTLENNFDDMFLRQVAADRPNAASRLHIDCDTGSYIAHLKQIQREADEARVRERQAREAEAMAQCTFVPMVNHAAPAYVRRLADAHRSARKEHH